MSNRAVKSCLLLLLLMTLTLGGCSEEISKPENLVAEDTYIDLMIELQLLEAYRSSFHPDSVNIDSLKNIVFDEYGVSEQQFSNSHRYYQLQPTLQKKRISQAMDTLREQMVKEGMIDSIRAEKMKQN